MKLAILGFAHGHVGMYCTAWRQQPGLDIQVVAGWDHDAERLAKSTADHQLTPVTALADILSQPDIAGVVIAAETSKHAELVEAAAAAGKAIVLQKPLALTMAEADRIVTAVERRHVPFTLAWQMRVDPENLRMREVLASGVLGRLLTVRRRHCLSTHTWGWFPGSWHVRPELNRDVWADDAAHPVDFIYWLCGLPETVTAELASLVDPRVPNDNGVALFRYADGRLAEVSCSFTAVAGENTTEIVGDRGVLIQNYGDGPSSSVPRPPGAVSLKWFCQGQSEWTVENATLNQGHRIAGLAGPLAEFLHGRRPAIATAAEGRAVLRMILASYVSVRRGQRAMIADPATYDV